MVGKAGDNVSAAGLTAGTKSDGESERRRRRREARVGGREQSDCFVARDCLKMAVLPMIAEGRIVGMKNCRTLSATSVRIKNNRTEKEREEGDNIKRALFSFSSSALA